MDKQELQQLGDIKKEIEFLKRQIYQAENTVGDPGMISDSVKGSSKTFPFTERTFKIRGVDWSGYHERVERLKRKLSGKMEELMEKVDEINDYISSIPDSETRMILHCKFIKGMTWEEIEAELGISRATVCRRYKNWQQNAN